MTSSVVKKNPNYWQAGPLTSTKSCVQTGRQRRGSVRSRCWPTRARSTRTCPRRSSLTSPPAHFTVDNNLGTSPYDLQLNTAVPPCQQPQARQAIYAATNFAPILQHLFGSRYPTTDSFTGPGGICYASTCPATRAIDPTLAKQLIQETGLNKVRSSSGTIALSTAQELHASAGQRMGAARAQGQPAVLGRSSGLIVAAFEANGGKSWESMVQTAGAYDPAGGVGVGFRFTSASPSAGTRPQLDNLLNEAQASTNLSTRCRLLRPGGGVHRQELLRAVLLHPLARRTSRRTALPGPGLTTPLASVAVVPTSRGRTFPTTRRARGRLSR